MNEKIFDTVLSSGSAISVEALTKAYNEELVDLNIEPITSKVKDIVIKEIVEKEKKILEKKPDRDISGVRSNLEKTRKMYTDRKKNLEKQAKWEHLLALIFISVTGVIVCVAIIFLLFNKTTTPVVSLIASTIPSFASAIFYKREANIEKKIEKVILDIKNIDKALDRIHLAEIVRSKLSTTKNHEIENDFVESLFL